MRAVGFVCVGDPTDPWEWSGVPKGLYDALGALGHEPIWIDARPSGRTLGWVPRVVAATQLPGAWRWSRQDVGLRDQAYRLASAGTVNAMVLGVIAAVRGLRAPRDTVQMRGDLVPARRTRTVIFEDAIVPQVAEHRLWAFAQDLPPGLVRRRARHQRHAHRRAVASCAATGWTADAIVRRYGIPRHRVHVVGMGAEVIVDDPPRAWSAPRFLWIGLDWERKGGDAVLRAFERVRAQQPDAQLDLVGSHPRVSCEGVRGHGRLNRRDPGDRDLLGQLLSAATCFVMPSRLEPAGIVYAEAGLAGVASIGSTVGGAATMIGSGGVLVDPGDDAALVGAMLEMCAPEHAQALGRAARAHAANLTWRHVAERLVRGLDAPLAERLGYSRFLDR